MLLISFVFLFVFLLLYLLIIKIEKIRFGSILTPYFFLVTPFIFLGFLNIFMSNFTAFKVIDNQVIFYWMIYSTAFLFGGFVVWLLIRKDKYSNINLNNVNRLKSISLLSIFVSMVLLLIAIRLITTSAIPHYIASEQFASDFGNGLVIPLLRVISMMCLIYLVGHVNKKQLLPILSIIITIIPLLLYQVKGIILIPIIAGIIYRVYLGKLRITLGLSLKIIILGILLFIMTYSVSTIYLFGFSAAFNVDYFTNLINHSIFYLFSGILGFTSYLQSGISLVDEPQRIISPIWNTLRHITGWERVEVVTEISFQTTTDGSRSSNVLSIFGTMHGYMGFYLTFFGSMVLGFISYLFKFLANNINSGWFKVLYCFNLAILALGWFDYYYNYTFVWMFYAMTFVFFAYSIIKKPKIVIRK